MDQSDRDFTVPRDPKAPADLSSDEEEGQDISPEEQDKLLRDSDEEYEPEIDLTGSIRGQSKVLDLPNTSNPTPPLSTSSVTAAALQTALNDAGAALAVAAVHTPPHGRYDHRLKSVEIDLETSYAVRPTGDDRQSRHNGNATKRKTPNRSSSRHHRQDNRTAQADTSANSSNSHPPTKKTKGTDAPPPPQLKINCAPRPEST